MTKQTWNLVLHTHTRSQPAIFLLFKFCLLPLTFPDSRRYSDPPFFTLTLPRTAHIEQSNLTLLAHIPPSLFSPCCWHTLIPLQNLYDTTLHLQSSLIHAPHTERGCSLSGRHRWFQCLPAEIPKMESGVRPRRMYTIRSKNPWTDEEVIQIY